MPRFTTQQIISYEKTTDSISLITQHNNIGSLLIEVSIGDDWVITDTLTITGASEVFVKGRTMRFTPSGGMVYDVPVRE